MKDWIHENSEDKKNQRVVVVHCKAEKGRSGTMACSYLISECGWKPSEALARFTERRMRSGFGQGVSIPSQLRWVGYVDRWTRNGKVYIESQIEIMEVHVWGLRDDVMVFIEGYAEEEKEVKLFHMFTNKEQISTNGNVNIVSDMASREAEADRTKKNRYETLKKRNGGLGLASGTATSGKTDVHSSRGVVIFKPAARVILPTSDINIAFERRVCRIVTSVAHVWFNAFFEGSGPEKKGRADGDGVFEIDWDKMDGIRGSTQKGGHALDRLVIFWKAYNP
jgi:hypothetical protein